MPILKKVYQLEVTPEQFLRNCSREELKEIDLLLNSPEFRKRLEAPKKKEYLRFSKCVKCWKKTDHKELAIYNGLCRNCKKTY